MPAAEDRQAKALEGIERSVKEVVKILDVFNTNFVASFNFLQEQAERDKQNFSNYGEPFATVEGD